MKDDCIFCKLANHVFNTNIIYEDDDFTVILDAGPATRGHALILPKEHYANLYEITDGLLSKAAVLSLSRDSSICRADGLSFPYPPYPQIQG